MKLRRADCEHWILASEPPAGETKHGDPVYLCRACRRKALHRPAPPSLIEK